MSFSKKLRWDNFMYFTLNGTPLLLRSHWLKFPFYLDLFLLIYYYVIGFHFLCFMLMHEEDICLQCVHLLLYGLSAV